MIPEWVYAIITLVCVPLAFVLLFALYSALYVGKQEDEWMERMMEEREL